MNPQDADDWKHTKETLEWELGVELCALLEDPTVSDVMLNPDGKLFVERLGKPKMFFGNMDWVKAMAVIGTVAATMNTVINSRNPILECEFPLDGSRFLAVIPPVTTGPHFTIRKKAIMVFTLADYVEQGVMTVWQREIIETSVRMRDNILIAGSTGSGKTTLTNAVMRYLVDSAPDHRLLILEDTRELQCAAENAVSLKVMPGVDMILLVKTTMRENPDRILVGEVRDGAAHALLKAWNTGHPGGVVTMHANSAYAALTRMEQLVAEATISPVPSLIAEAVNVVVFIAKHPCGRLVEEIIRVTGHDGNKYLTESIGGSNV
ncbi:MAG: P-type conjugative transfer ATPase TrbB [Devosia sp.]